MATAESVFSGGGARANAAIGRAVRLALWNLGGTFPGEPVKEVFGHPGRFSYCIAETPTGEGRSPWPGLAEARGDVPAGASSVTVFACESPHSVAMWGADDEPEHRLAPVADALRVRGSNNAHTMGEALIAFTPGEARHLASRGYDRARVQTYLFAQARNSIATLRPRGRVAARRVARALVGVVARLGRPVPRRHDGARRRAPGRPPRRRDRRRQHPVGRRLPRLGPPRRLRRLPPTSRSSSGMSPELVDPRGSVVVTTAELAPASSDAGRRDGARVPGQRGHAPPGPGLLRLHARARGQRCAAGSRSRPSTVRASRCSPGPRATTCSRPTGAVRGW